MEAISRLPVITNLPDSMNICKKKNNDNNATVIDVITNRMMMIILFSY